MLLGLFITTVSVWSLKYKCKWSYLLVGPTPASVLWCVAHQVTISPVLCWSVSVSDHCLCSASSPCVDPQLELPWLPARLAAPASSPSPVPAWFCKYTTHSHSSTLPIQQTGSFPSILANYCWFQSHVLWLHLFIISIYFTFDLDNLPFHIHYSLSNMKWIEMYITFCWPFNSLKYLLIGNIFNKKYLREDNEMHPKERSVFTLANFYECDIGKQLSFFSKLSIADLGPDKYELITETGSHFSKKHHSHHT